MNETQDGIKIAQRNINDLRYAHGAYAITSYTGSYDGVPLLGPDLDRRNGISIADGNSTVLVGDRFSLIADTLIWDTEVGFYPHPTTNVRDFIILLTNFNPPRDTITNDSLEQDWLGLNFNTEISSILIIDEFGSSTGLRTEIVLDSFLPVQPICETSTTVSSGSRDSLTIFDEFGSFSEVRKEIVLDSFLPVQHISETFTTVSSGSWHSTCTWQDSMGNPGVPTTSDEKTINSGHSVTISSSVSNSGTINNHGTITNSSTITNSGTIKNNSGGTIKNNSGGAINNNSGGTINNNPGGAINNNNSGTITNEGTINNNGGTINNKLGATIKNNFGGTINNGSINNTGTLTNTGAITNSGIITQ